MLRAWALSVLVITGTVPLGAQTSPPWEPITASERGQFYIDPTSVRKVDGIPSLRAQSARGPVLCGACGRICSTCTMSGPPPIATCP